jgi:hypothetical protein
MNLLKKWNLISGMLCTCFLASVSGQTEYELTFQGLLADIEGTAIMEDTFTLAIQIHPVNKQNMLYEYTSQAETDGTGWFGFTISNIAEFMMEEDGSWKSIVLQMEFSPNTHTDWIKEGNDFLVNYTLAPSKIAGDLFQMTRMEGSGLEVYSEEHLHAFRDHYPFAYLTGGFLITDQPPIDSLSITDLRQWLTPTEEDEDAASRGIKGGFPVGGYRKKR